MTQRPCKLLPSINIRGLTAPLPPGTRCPLWGTPPGLCAHLAPAALPGEREVPCRSETGLSAAKAL